jgi:histidinol-phosphate phosphatase family protein
MKLIELGIDKSWTLFLDRDGVINLHYPNDYVKNWKEFFFLEGSLEAIKHLSHIFGRTLIVTNQQGVGKKLMSEQDLNHIHSEMLKEIRKYGGRIHMIYAATQKIEDDTWKMRKPNIGMAKQAKKDFPEIDLQKSIIVGDSISDMQFGRNAGMKTVYLGDESKLDSKSTHLIDLYSESLYHFSSLMT